MYPSLPYPGYKWSMNHHMGVAIESNVYGLVWTAETYKSNPDPVNEINTYLNANTLLTKNVRADTKQPEGWRDYQQISSELGLLFSTKLQRDITLTPLGLAFFEKIVKFDELMTMQALRYQYPNGHKSNISSSLRKQLAGTQFQNIKTLTELQALTGVRIRPGVLIWRVLRELQSRGENNLLTVLEAQNFLLPCIRHENTLAAVDALVASRHSDKNQTKQTPYRDIEEWFRFMLSTPLFKQGEEHRLSLKISDFGIAHGNEIDVICTQLEAPNTFWMPDPRNSASYITWYAEFGSIDLNINLVSPQADEPVINEPESEEREHESTAIQSINLRPFDPDNLFNTDDTLSNAKHNKSVNIEYDSDLSKSQHSLHNKMIIMIANICSQNGGQVFDDPKSIDLLVRFENYEFIIEVKTVTSHNFVKRLRLALGQLLHYDYLRGTQFSHRKVVAFPARISSDSWHISFINDFLDFDLLTLGARGLELKSNFSLSRKLFLNNYVQTSLFESFPNN
ncbi:MAG: hypothetical protein WA584_17685 [Pyrinomonadaceae bacterium]